jgi:hypothetical protein
MKFRQAPATLCRVDGTIAPLGEACCVARPLDAEPALLERVLAIRLEPLGRGYSSCELARAQR